MLKNNRIIILHAVLVHTVWLKQIYYHGNVSEMLNVTVTPIYEYTPSLNENFVHNVNVHNFVGNL